eukprot:CAMPEP_0178373146 /NCGR_PEP_ID=MMETSP0689_2-20121128/1714_1 /TAXON_ID=160604 /ORGANISM="Amphidinium massartii, Strain CS-259" /LENGTH=325 /DNA_ID=CAMNT_0019993083 /DNA_START=26 /DNA_END=1000 /DNA_ORIENTATION=+
MGYVTRMSGSCSQDIVLNLDAATVAAALSQDVDTTPLCVPTFITLRTSTQLSPRAAAVVHNSAKHRLEFSVQDVHKQEELTLLLAEIAVEELKIIEMLVGLLAGAAVYPQPQERSKSNFPWSSSRKTNATGGLHSHTGWLPASLDAKKKTKHGQLIKRITNEGHQGMETVRVRVDLHDNSSCTLGLRDANAAPQRCKSVVRNFVEYHEVAEEEGPPLHRFLQSMISTASLQEDTLAIINEVNALHLEEVTRVEQTDLENPVGLLQAKEYAQKKLKELSNSLDSRIASRGPAAQIVALILRRNVEKMRAINEMFFQATVLNATPDV